MPLARRELLALAGIGAAAAAAGAFWGALRLQSRGGDATALLHEPFTDFDGRVTRLRDWSSTVLLCNFWATWCPPCREEVPLLIAAKQQFASKGFEIAGIGIDDVAKLREFAANYKISYPVLIATGRTPNLLRDLGDNTAALPYSVLLDRERHLVRRKLGAWTKAELDREIAALIG
jgi:thiol-disulfide isomerase/thioredoxin